ncbi:MULTISPECIES: type I-E CRISPR-associated endoribonuclease Cas2 [unclassified Crossiella]|uniref:type I-E CRISPR-associated endoribonuclease Cas2 n=1 Tax=unclassified Crossiella TaxID=2620835 RepID=UPI001FFEFB09|nr:MULTISPECIES: type I-E CRISPR-associated endoribonuclease Cas2 [unclassified Crossiella]MCK2241905.1 type I-E CRISPR-associated endoribonuclease Cas2 [Crossiella sp. S99.2]MCK2255808.1 type I-E CRISPR-associated endoribonuclease Cas2 [Crossiella sp. S99.1]
MCVGTVSARVRHLWDNVSAAIGDGAAVLVHPADNEQSSRSVPQETAGASPTNLTGSLLIRWRAHGDEFLVPW